MQFIDLHAQQARLKADIDAGIADVLRHGRYILGPQVTELESKLAKFIGAKHTVSCANGTDAITLPLMAWNIGGRRRFLSIILILRDSRSYCLTRGHTRLCGY